MSNKEIDDIQKNEIDPFKEWFREKMNDTLKEIMAHGREIGVNNLDVLVYVKSNKATVDGMAGFSGIAGNIDLSGLGRDTVDFAKYIVEHHKIFALAIRLAMVCTDHAADDQSDEEP